nr:hypothetical protein [Vibrio vulnificus]
MKLVCGRLVYAAFTP